MAQGQVVVSGATGLVGRRLVPRLAERFSSIVALSRSSAPPRDAAPGVRVEGRSWDGIDPGAAVLGGADALIHLAGEPLFGGLPTEARLERVRASRVDSTRRIVERMGALPAGERPKVLVCASAVGIYGDRGEELLDERAPAGSGYLAGLCRAWEEAAVAAEGLGVRVVRVRIGVALAREGGALALMRKPFAWGLGGRLGSGAQRFPWIHIDDLVSALLFVLERQDLSGPVNAVAPAADTNADLTRALARVLGRPAIVPVPGFAIRGLLGPLADELLGSKRVVPARLQSAGFIFRHPTLAGALAAELGH